MKTSCRICGKALEVEGPLLGDTVVCDQCIADYERTTAVEEARRKWRLLCPPDFQRTDLRHPEFNSPAWHILQQIDPTRNVILLGATGRCKTRMALERIKRALLAGRSCSVIWPEEIRELAGSHSRQLAWLQLQSSFDLVLLDDPFFAGVASESTSELLKDLLDRRLRWARSTLLTTQINAEEFRGDAAKFRGHTASEARRIDAIIRRIRGQFAVVNCDGEETGF